MSSIFKALCISVAMFPELAFCQEPTIHTVIGKSGIGFRHFEVELSAQNTFLHSETLVERRNFGESHGGDLQFGQFEIFIPANQLKLNLGCKTEYNVRMPRTEDSANLSQIKQKQALWQYIKKAVDTKSGSVRVVIEIKQDSGCSLYFRTGLGGKYIDYVGTIRD